MGASLSSVEKRPDRGEVMRWLSQVPDPEIPVVSVTDLGIVRQVAWQGDTLVVTITPTYSGCPAVSVIAMDIESELVRRGIKKLTIQTQLTPAWTTDWIGEKARQKLKGLWHRPTGCGGTMHRCLASTGENQLSPLSGCQHRMRECVWFNSL